MDELKVKIGIAVHKFLQREIEQFALVQAGKPRTDGGYQAHLEVLSEDIIKITNEHQPAK